jgi:pre-mRNA-processing factor 6
LPTGRSALVNVSKNFKKAFVANPESEQIWLAADKLEGENGELDVARKLLVRIAGTERVSVSSLILDPRLT